VRLALSDSGNGRGTHDLLLSILVVQLVLFVALAFLLWLHTLGFRLEYGVSIFKAS